MSLPKLNFPPYKFRLRVRSGQPLVWDALRGSWLCCTPEEWVRRHTIQWLIEGQGVAAQRIAQEYPVALGGMAQRADIVVMDGAAKPMALVECKAPFVKIDASVLDQAVRYNSVVGARYIMLTNGLTHYFYEMADGDYSPCSGIPEFK